MAKIVKQASLFCSPPATRAATSYLAPNFAVHWLYTAANYDPAPEVYLEVTMKISSASYSARAALYTAAGAIAGSAITTQSTNPVLVRSANLYSSLVNGTAYQVRISTSSASGTMTIYKAVLVIIQNGTIVKTETVFDFGDSQTGAETIYTDDAMKGRWLYDSSQFDGTVAFYYEMYGSPSVAAQTWSSQMYDGSSGIGEVTLTGQTTDARVRSGSITPVNGHEYRVQNKATTGANYRCRGARLIITQTNSPTKTESYIPLAVRGVAAGYAAQTNMSMLHYWDDGEWDVSSYSVMLEGLMYATSGQTGYCDLNDGANDISTISTQATSRTRVRGSPFDPADNITFDIQWRPSGGSVYPFGAWLVVQATIFAAGPDQDVIPSGVESGETFGQPALALNISPTSITSEDAFGSPTLTVGDVNVVPTGVDSGEAFGTATILPGAVAVVPSGIDGGSAFGTPTITVAAVTVLPGGIASGEAFGSVTVLPQPVTVTPTGIPTGETFGNPTLAYNLSPSGIGSGEAFGSQTVTPGAVTASPGGIASGEGFGAATVTRGAVAVAPVGIPSGEAFGSATVAPQPVTVSPGGIPSAEAFGAVVATAGSVTVSPSGIPSGETFGTTTLEPQAVSVSPSGIPSDEVFGTPVVGAGQLISPSGIASGEAFGMPAVTRYITDDFNRVDSNDPGPNWTVTQGTFHILGNQLTCGGIADSKMFWNAHKFADDQLVQAAQLGTTWRALLARGSGLGSNFAAYACWIANTNPSGTVSLRLGYTYGTVWGAYLDAAGTNVTVHAGDVLAFGVTGQDQNIVLTAYVNGVAVKTLPWSSFTNQAIIYNHGQPGIHYNGSATVVMDNFAAGPIEELLLPTGIPTDAAFGTPALLIQEANLYPSAIPSDEAFGTPDITVGTVDIAPAGVASDEQFGSATVQTGQVAVSPSSIASSEAFGSVAVSTGPVTVSPAGIASGEAFGTPALALNVVPTGISSGETFGTPSLTTGSVSVVPTGIPSGEAFGIPSVQSGAGYIYPTGIPCDEAFGTASLTTGPVSVSPSGIPSSEAFGNQTVQPGDVSVGPSGIAPVSAFGNPSVEYAIGPSGIASGAAFGNPTATPGPVTVSPSSIASGEQFGAPGITVSGVYIYPAAIPSAETFGTPQALPGAVIVASSGISSGETFGIPGLLTGPVIVYPVGIQSGEAFGETVFTWGKRKTFVVTVEINRSFSGSFLLVDRKVTQVQEIQRKHTARVEIDREVNQAIEIDRSIKATVEVLHE